MKVWPSGKSLFMRRRMPLVHPRRHFQLIDIIVLVAATAVGFALVRWYDREGGFSLVTMLFEIDESRFRWGWLTILMTRSALFLSIISPIALTFTLATFALRLRQPRPCRRRLFRQAGVAGCSSVILLTPSLFVARILGSVQFEGRFEGSKLGGWLIDAFRYTFPSCGYMVAAVWLNLWLTARWVSEPSWIDRLGRALSIYWIAASVVTLLITLYY